MSQNVSENDIWEYQPLKKKKRLDTERPESSKGPLAKYREFSKRITKKETSILVKNTVRDMKLTQVDYSKDVNVKANESIHNKEVVCMTHLTQNITSSQSIQENISTLGTGKKVYQASSLGGFCPICQMPFSILVVQSQRWHVAECLDTPGDDSKECPDGFQCSSTIPSHYKRYSHSILAQTRAISDTALLSVSQNRETDELPCFSLSGHNVIDQRASLALESLQESAVTLSNQSSSINNGHLRVTTKKPNALQLLRSPAVGDIRKKKGWKPIKGMKSTNAFHDYKTKVSAPVNNISGYDCIEVGFVKAEASASSDEISYSPISRFVNRTQPRKSLFPNDLFEDGDNYDSVLLFNDSVSNDDGLFSGLAHSETKEVVGSPFNTDTQLVSSSLLKPNNHPPSSSKGMHTEDNFNPSTASLSVQSPQRIVLERLRDHLLSPSNNSFHSKSFYHCSGHTNTELNMPLPHVPPSSQAFPTTHQSQETMEPRKGQVKAVVSGLKQTDIGVFFGSRPLKDKDKEQEAGTGTVLPGVSLQQASVVEENQQGHRGLQRKGRGAKGTPKVVMLSASGSTQCLRDGGRGGRTGERKRWNRGRTDGEPREHKRCPFYKRIPGTKFAVDAFQYGLVEGITSYFLTHFHSDHYGGLKKSSTFPIYCNRITGNLVKSKLKVAEQYVHILPMNIQVTVDQVKVTLLDANHCPGAAMLLFFLPDGQTVLHTGDFRADPSMEDYYELMNCRVQTLYLDTTYCSPEYTFPTQQEVINFATNTAFECVTQHPRTLVVCGSYSVGKEKVFLALAEVLGTKVCMSKDKFNTMCCLESERIRQLITTAWETAQVHVLPMMQLNFKNLQAHLTRFSGQYDKLLAFKPTGWTFSHGVEDVRPKVQGNISIYGIPYSEHSSYLELRRFVQWIQPLKIIPTVNVGSWACRKAMERCFHEWLTEAKANNFKGIQKRTP
ncbi:DNA cross-link repair 1A protein isoform X1 [Esox lucius]|nr:DNA cross-link repair 1A protein isoform X1 [Esox lucius]